MSKKEILKLVRSLLGRKAVIQAPLVGGMMNISFIILDKATKKRYVLYIPTEQANEMVNRPLEKEHLSIASSLGITSKNIYFDTSTVINMNEYIEVSSIDKVDSFDYDKIAEIFRIFHSSSTLSKLDYNPFDRFVNQYEKEALSFQDEPNPKYVSLREFLFRYKEYLESQKKVLSHNDAQRSNIVKGEDDKYYLIDFEFVGNNDEIYDIATFGNGLVSEGRELLNHYFSKVTDGEISRYYLWRIYISLQWYNVAIVKHFRGEGKAHGFDFMKVAEHFLNNATDAYNGFRSEIK